MQRGGVKVWVIDGGAEVNSEKGKERTVLREFRCGGCYKIVVVFWLSLLFVFAFLGRFSLSSDSWHLLLLCPHLVRRRSRILGSSKKRVGGFTVGIHLRSWLTTL